MKRPIIIAIDGYSSCGKSTLAKALAYKLNFAYVDTGAMYRAVTLYCLHHDVDWEQEADIQQALQQITIAFRRIEGTNHTFLNGEDVEALIRSMRISEQVSRVSAVSSVRKALVAQQKALGEAGGLVMDGRDIGTVVFPQAELKLFMTSDLDVRAMRRLQELQSKGEQQLTLEAVKANLMERDEIDSNRSDSPLRQAEDAILFDNTFLTPDEQLDMALRLVQEAQSFATTLGLQQEAL